MYSKTFQKTFKNRKNMEKKMFQAIQNIDNLIMNNIPFLYEDTLNTIMLLTTNLISIEFVCVLFIILLILAKNKKDISYLIVGSAITVLINRLIKNIIQRPRPEGIKLTIETGYSFPSAHAMLSVFIYGFIIFLLLKNQKDKKNSKMLSIALGVLILWISFTRIYLGVHYLSDVIVGALFGGICLFIYIKFVYNKDLFKNIKKIKNTKKDTSKGSN